MTNSTPNVRKLESIGMKAKRIWLTLRVDVPGGYVLLEHISHSWSDQTRVEAGYTFYYGPGYAGSKPALSQRSGRATSSSGQRGDSEHYMWRDDSIGNSLKLLADDWGHGMPDFDSIHVETKNSPVEGVELETLVLAAWLEVFGQEVPEPGELVNRVNVMRQKHEKLRAQCFIWLRSGPLGAEKWNSLRVDEFQAIGKLGKCQFGGCDLRGVWFGNQDLRNSDFREANLLGARFGGADCRGADFRGANLRESWLSGGRFLQADFSGANLCDATVRCADCTGAVFSDTDLSGVDLSSTDARGADFSSANLDRVDVTGLMYDERTKFPPGVVIQPEFGMVWRGAIARGPEYRSECSLDELLALIPAPPNPQCATGNWNEIEAQLGIHFPSDFKQLINVYGCGNILGSLEIYNPLTERGRNQIAESLDMLEESREACEYLWPIHPEEAGMLPWGDDVNGNIFCWLTKGESDDWATAQMGHGADEPDSDNVNITTFLFNYARNQYPEMLGGIAFEVADYRFTAFDAADWRFTPEHTD